MIARRNSNHASAFLFVRERKDFVGCAASFEGAGALQVFAFEEDFTARNFVERARSHDRRTVDAPGDSGRGLFD
jgi:hypothetical protein